MENTKAQGQRGRSCTNASFHNIPQQKETDNSPAIPFVNTFVISFDDVNRIVETVFNYCFEKK